MTAVPDVVKRLVERFDRNADTYKSPAYNETQLRVEFVNPFWKALGWDVDNVDGRALAYRQVVHEGALKVGGATKAPDYSFRIGGTRKFFVETKRPAVNLKQDPSPAYQVRRYAWSSKLPLSVVTDFEEFAVYDCTVRPKKTDKASAARVLYLTYREYLERWEDMASIFSREAVLKGDFDRFAESKRRKRGTTEVDTEFLKEIEAWRDALARNIALRNPALSVRELNFCVQKTIDRIIFLRMCEDRGIEPSFQLQGLCGGSRIYPRLVHIYHRADDRYNSGLFHFAKEKGRETPPDDLTPALTIDDKVLKDILTDLYYPESPYEFSVLPAEILGNVYEQFLGKVIRLTRGHRAKVEDKPEVRKAGGVYYTPRYIVHYIVKNTVGRLCEGKTPREVAALRILDPACGSGSFLLGAYQYLIDWHRDYYTAEMEKTGKVPTVPPARGSRRRKSDRQAIYEGGGSEWRLTTAEKKRILLNNIYGVDIDPQAVEVTKLSLLLAVLEGENQETLETQMRIFHERALPDLASNIKCGNSLIGPDYFQGKQMSLLDDEEVYRINAFDWHDPQHGFGEIMKAGGFDAVIGNPPYVRSVNLKESDPLLWELYRSRYRAASAREWDIYLIMVEKGLTLLRSEGNLGFILPNKFLNSKVGENVRGILSGGRHLRRVVHFGAYQVFKGATTYTCLLFLGGAGTDRFEVARYTGPLNQSGSACPLPDEAPGLWSVMTMAAERLTAAPWVFPRSGGEVLEKLRGWPQLGTIAHVFSGTGTRADRVYLLESRGWEGQLVRVYSPEKEAEYLLEPTFLKPAFRGRSIGRYKATQWGLLLIVPYEVDGDTNPLVSREKLEATAPRTLEYLVECQGRLNQREKGRFKGEAWYRYSYPRNMGRFEVAQKIVMPDVANRGTCYLDREARWLLDTAYALVLKPTAGLDLRYLLGILNSRLLTYFLKETGSPLRGGYFRMKTAYLNPFPTRAIDFSNPDDVKKHDRMVALVERMLDLHKRLPEVKTPDAKTRLQRQIAATDKEIDQLVYDLYGLTDDEIRIVEEGDV